MKSTIQQPAFNRSLRIKPQRHGQTRPLTGVIALLILILGGCGQYQIGPQGLYPSGIQTVYVPMFESDLFRPGINEWLSEAVVKQIESQTPFKVVSTPVADSVLTGRLLDHRKQVLVESPNDDPRDLSSSMVLMVTWYARNGELLMQHRFDVGTHFLPESGQSMTTAHQEVIQRLAQEIVGRMEITNW